MTKTVRFDPFRDMPALADEVTRLFGSLGAQPVARAAAGATWVPPMDVFDTAEAIVLKMDLPGLAGGDVDVEIDNSVLTIAGERRFEEPVDTQRNHRLERTYGKFARTLTLPKDVRSDEIAASFSNGVLEIRVPKAEEVKPRKITVDVDAH